MNNKTKNLTLLQYDKIFDKDPYEILIIKLAARNIIEQIAVVDDDTFNIEGNCSFVFPETNDLMVCLTTIPPKLMIACKKMLQLYKAFKTVNITEKGGSYEIIYTERKGDKNNYIYFVFKIELELKDNDYDIVGLNLLEVHKQYTSSELKSLGFLG